ncbi:hypothetical protein NPIL_639161 [Nephila pilipes]|uniref:Uncharacterized protein n=1 Tax=Nephila pilipes TaxID=299642 RepID=A0A8X6UKN5_NEPPI|nr:hypothetical protein NPIL_639161 [Nephila pilipes]
MHRSHRSRHPGSSTDRQGGRREDQTLAGGGAAPRRGAPELGPRSPDCSTGELARFYFISLPAVARSRGAQRRTCERRMMQVAACRGWSMPRRSSLSLTLSPPEDRLRCLPFHSYRPIPE